LAQSVFPSLSEQLVFDLIGVRLSPFFALLTLVVPTHQYSPSSPTNTTPKPQANEGIEIDFSRGA